MVIVTFDGDTARFGPVGRARRRAGPFAVARSEVESLRRTGTRVELDLGEEGVLVLITGAWKVLAAWAAGSHELPPDTSSERTDESSTRPGWFLAGTRIRLDR